MDSSKKELLPTEIFAGILSYLQDLEVAEIPSRQREIHKAIFEMRKKGLKILKQFRFDTTGVFPYSPTIEQATSNLATSLLLERNNPRLNKYLLTSKLKSHFETNIKPRASNDALKQINRIAQHVRERIKN